MLIKPSGVVEALSVHSAKWTKDTRICFGYFSSFYSKLFQFLHMDIFCLDLEKWRFFKIFSNVVSFSFTVLNLQQSSPVNLHKFLQTVENRRCVFYIYSIIVLTDLVVLTCSSLFIFLPLFLFLLPRIFSLSISAH